MAPSDLNEKIDALTKQVADLRIEAERAACLDKEIVQLTVENDHLISLRERDMERVRSLQRSVEVLQHRLETHAGERRQLRRTLGQVSWFAVMHHFKETDAPSHELHHLHQLEGDLRDVRSFYNQSPRFVDTFYHHYVVSDDGCLSLVLGLEEDEATFSFDSVSDLRLALREHPVFQEVSCEVLRVALKNDIVTVQLDDRVVEIRIPSSDGSTFQKFQGLTWMEAWRNAVNARGKEALLPWFVEA